MNLGAEPKKIAILGTLALIGGYVFYTNVLSSPQAGPTAVKKSPAVAVGGVKGPTAPANIQRNRTPVRGAALQEFKPTLKPRPEDRPNYATIDPTLNMGLLAKVQAVSLEGGARSVFQFSTPAAEPVKVAAIKPAPRMYGPQPPPKPTPPAPPPAAPPPPPITLKFYGYSKPKADGVRRAFFMDGEDIFIAGEGELVKKRYRVVKIDANWVVMEDTEFKNNRQTLQIQQEQQG